MVLAFQRIASICAVLLGLCYAGLSIPLLSRPVHSIFMQACPFHSLQQFQTNQLASVPRPPVRYTAFPTRLSLQLHNLTFIRFSRLSVHIVGL